MKQWSSQGAVFLKDVYVDFNPSMHNVVKWPNIMHERVNLAMVRLWSDFE